MRGDEEELCTFLEGFGFSEDELAAVSYQLGAFKSIPGTTMDRYLKRILETIVEEDRSAFLKGVFVGVAIRKAADALEEPDLTEEEKRILQEIEKLGSDKH